MSEVQRLLDDKGLMYREKGADLLVKCLSPEHEDAAPSMRIDRFSGVFHCLSCGYKGNIYKYFNKIPNRTRNKITSIADSISELRRSTIGLDIPDTAMGTEGDFRGIPHKLLEQFGAFEDPVEFPDRIVFPLSDICGRIQVFIARYKHSDAPPKYIFKPANVAPPLIPASVVMINTSIVFVEGIFDMLNCHQYGLTNTVCIFGTKKLTEHNVADELMPFVIQGCTKVWLMMDGDKAGMDAQKHLEHIIKAKTDLDVEAIELDEGQDPGDLSKEEVASIIEWLET